MKRSSLALAVLILVSALATPGIAAPAPEGSKSMPAGDAGGSVQPPARNILYIDGLPDTAGVFLPDTAMLAHVDRHVITAGEFVQTYYDAYAPDRSDRDSSGRVEWLNSMVNKEVLGRVARAANRPLGFEDRQVLREHTQRVLSNTLFLRAVMDSVSVSEADVQALGGQLGTEYHLRLMVVPGAEHADSVYRDLVAKKIGWPAAYARYAMPQENAAADGDIGWISRFGMTWAAADRVIGLKSGAFSKPLRRVRGFEIYSCLETRTVERPPVESLRGWIVSQVRTRKAFELADRLQASIRRTIGMSYDSLNIAWAAPQFRPAFTTGVGKDGAPTFHMNHFLPIIKPADTSRVLARYRDGTLTLSRFLPIYAMIPTTRRPDISTPEGFRSQIDAIVLEPYRARIAVERGLDKDPSAVAQIEKERERILVEHMYQDSVESRIFISKDQRRKYYKDHLAQFYTYPAARYAQLAVRDSLAAEALAKRLRAGERADDILRADSLAGRPRSGTIKVERESDHTALHQLVFENLKPGQCEIVGPDGNGKYAVVQLLSFDPGHQLSFEESDGYVNDALQAQASEGLLNQLIARHRRRYTIETRPELVMRIRLRDPEAER